MPLVWAHAEFLKLLVARENRRPVERLDCAWRRYAGTRPAAATWYWRSEVPFDSLPAGRALVIEDSRPFVLHLGWAGWQRVEDRASQPIGLSMHGIRLAHSELAPGVTLNFTRFYRDAVLWEGVDHEVTVDVNG